MARMDFDSARRGCKTLWRRSLNEAVEADQWGQYSEAHEAYEKLGRIFEEQANELFQCGAINAAEMQLIMRCRHAVLGRAQELADPTAVQQAGVHITLEQMKQLKTVVDEIFSGQVEFPIALNNYAPERLNDEHVIEGEDESVDEMDVITREREERLQQAMHKKSPQSLRRTTMNVMNPLLPPPQMAIEKTYVVLSLERIGLKDAEVYQEPRITISVAQRNQKILEAQDIIECTRMQHRYIHFNTTVHIQTPLDDIESRDAAIFFEFKHFKASKDKLSTRCYAMIEPGEIQKAFKLVGAVALELYKKPVDYSRKKTNLFTVKPLYLHVQVSFLRRA